MKDYFCSRCGKLLCTMAIPVKNALCPKCHKFTVYDKEEIEND